MTRPYPQPPTNVQLTNDYVGDDRGIFLTREPVKRKLRVVEAEWTTFGPNASPGHLRFKLGIGPDFTQKLKLPDGTEWFETVTSGPNFRPILVEYWAKHIYYNYYATLMDPLPVPSEQINGIIDAGNSQTRAFVPSIASVENIALYYATVPTKALTLEAYDTSVRLATGGQIEIDQSIDTLDDKFDPVLFASRQQSDGGLT